MSQGLALRTDSELLSEIADCLAQLSSPEARSSAARSVLASQVDDEAKLAVIGGVISELASDHRLLQVIGMVMDALDDDRLRLPTDSDRLSLALCGVRVSARLEIWLREVLGGVERTEAAWHEHQTSATTWLAEAGNLTPKQARGLIRSGEALDRFEIVRAAARQGRVLPVQAEAITMVLSELPAEFPAQAIAAGQELLVGFADTHNSSELRRLTAHLVEVLAPETAEELEAKRLDRAERRAQSRRHLEFWGDGEGSVLIRGSLPVAQAEPFIQIIDSYVAAERRALDGLDPHAPLLSPGMRRADALMAMIQRHGQEALAPSNGGDRPRIIMTMSWDGLRQQCLDAGLARESASNTDGGLGATGAGGLGATAGAGGLSQLPEPVARLTRCGTPLPPSQVRQLLCDADLMPIVLGGQSEILDLGRSRRLVSPSIRAGLEVRDGGCVFPGCDKPPQGCHAHHIVPWWVGGPTDLSNLVLVCPHHHGIVEPSRDPAADRWQVELGPDGRAQVIPPTRVDATQRPRRHARFEPPAPDS